MPTIREFYFLHLGPIFTSKYINDPQFIRLLAICNGLKDRTEVMMHFDDEMQNIPFFNRCIDEILQGKMFEYVVEEAYFDEKYFKVNKNVLIPRQETEELVAYFRKFVNEMYSNGARITIGDICTGSGCVAISLADGKIGKNIVYASDISKDVLKVAKENNLKHKTDVRFLLGNITDPYVEKGIRLDCIICNPPYISDVDGIDKRTWEQEPHLALLSEPETYFYEYVLKESPKILKDKHIIAFEIGEKMKKPLGELAKKYFPLDEVKFMKDMDGKWRFMFLINQGYPDKEAVATLKNHGIIAFPTETVMGLGIVYDDLEAFNKLNKIKGRPENKPYSLMLGRTKQITRYAEVSPIEQKIIDKFLPGPLTILLKKKTLPEWVTLGSPYVGIRVPDDPQITSVIKALGKPILAPSANKSGYPPALDSYEVKKKFGDDVDYIIEGEALNGVASTIVKVDNGVEIIRQGEITKEEIEEAIK